METYFRGAPRTLCAPYSTQHVIVLIVICVGMYVLYQYQDLLRQKKWNRIVRYTIAF
ncbi:hypothetical protein [Bacillus cytotoxicus]|uniref:hypothetical protein n=1 Tax=Bacillus cytotoxicus TaxID=580165 RepID=UPI001AEDEB97|nr:hypothetical protein [Bacillus cytotoxicus]QTR80664.1 hypothetical protein JC773_09745 [Bacillus cytotoxicus]